MTVRRGMADYRQAGAGGIIFMGLLQLQGMEMTYAFTRTVARRVYSAELAKLETQDKEDKYEKDIQRAIDKCQILLDKALDDYRTYFEDHNSVDQAENEYAELLSQVVDQLWIIAIKGKLIENITVTQEEV